MKNTELNPKYVELDAVLRKAYNQAASGKGRERHANDQFFEDQSLMVIGRQVGLGFPLGQALKKITELHGMQRRGESESAQTEILGAIVYLCSAYLLIEEKK
jgi:fructoselysine-6-P-deglycase FrlB-like protein